MSATESYRPSNGTEGELFMSDWCDRCAKLGNDKVGWCRIQGASFLFDIDDPGYPTEWVCDVDSYPGNPRCTAFMLVLPPEVTTINDARQMGLFG